MITVRDIIIAGLLLGGIFALVSIGLSLQYGVARVLNVARGEFIMIGACITFWLLARGTVTRVEHPDPLPRRELTCH